MGVATKEDLERLIVEGKAANRDVSRLETVLAKGYYYPLENIPMGEPVEIVMSDGKTRKIITTGPLVEDDLKRLE